MCADVFSPAGYAAHSRLVLKALLESGYLKEVLALKLLSRPKDKLRVPLPKSEQTFLDQLQVSDIGKPDLVFFLEPCQFYEFGSIPSVGFMHWETSAIRGNDSKGQKMNQVHQLNRCVGIGTSATSCKYAFQDSGVVSPVSVIPGPIFDLVDGKELPVAGVNTKAGKHVPPAKRPFVVGYMAQWTARKNIDTFIRASCIALKGTNSAILLKTYGRGIKEEKAEIIEACRRIKASTGVGDELPVIVITETLSDEEVNGFFRTIDVYFAPSRGEGYSMPCALAASARKPVIAPDWGGPAEFIPREMLIPGCFTLVSGNPIFEPDQFWYEIDHRKAVLALRKMAQMTREERNSVGQEVFAYAMKTAGAKVFADNFVQMLMNAFQSSSARRQRVSSI